jgi:transcriptional regulator
MHPNSVFRNGDRDLHEGLIAEVGFGMVFLATPDGPRVAHTPLLLRKQGAETRLAFHLARGNALTRHLDGAEALAVINGPDGYVTPRWYADQGTVPTWNYVAIEAEGPVRRLDREGLLALLADLSAHNEARIPGAPWTMDKTPPAILSKLLDAIVGFELTVTAWRPTFKLSQNKDAADRASVADGFDANGSPGIAALMRALGEQP